MSFIGFGVQAIQGMSVQWTSVYQPKFWKNIIHNSYNAMYIDAQSRNDSEQREVNRISTFY